MASKNGDTVSASKLAKLCGLTTRRIGQLCDDGVITRAGKKGEFKPDECIPKYITYIKQQSSTTKDSDRLEKAKADKAEFEMARLNIEFAPTHLLQKYLDDAISIMIQSLDSLPKVASIKLVGIQTQPEAEHIIRDEVDKLRKDLSSPDIYEAAEKLIEKEYERKSKHNPH